MSAFRDAGPARRFAGLFFLAFPFAALATPPPQPAGILPDGAPLSLVHRQSLYAGFAGNRVGDSVSLAGDLLAVGVPDADAGSVPGAGRVDIYRWFDELAGWSLITSFTTQSFGITPVASARFGAAVSLSGEWLLAGCPGCNPADDAKAILVRIPAVIEGGDASHGGLEWRRVTPPALAGFGDPFEGTGSAVALSVVRSGSVISPSTSIVFAVGSPKATFGVFELGAVAMGRYEPAAGNLVWESGPWYGSADFGKLGASLAISAATWVNLGLYFNERNLVVGEPGWVPSGGSGVQGRATLWARSGSTWTSLQNLTAADPGFFDALGSAVAVERASDDALGTVALGAPGRNLAGTPGGSVIVLRQQAIDGLYLFDQELQHPDAETADRYGTALALSQGRLLVGADGRAVDFLANAGAAYLYRREFNLLIGAFSWRLKQTLTEPREPGGNSAFGTSVALGPRVAAIGAPLSDAAGLVDAGRVATYLCDRIFSDGIEGQASNACARP